MPEELDAIRTAIAHPVARIAAGREITEGTIGGQRVAAAFSRWGKVSAAATAAHLLSTLQPSCVVFTGIAGALRDDLDVGDFVLARDLYQHDLDASPFFPPTHVPLLERAALPADPVLTSTLHQSLQRVIARGVAGDPPPRLRMADIATGDQVIGSRGARAAVSVRVPHAACVEMEGAAVAQVCFEYAVPFACVRMISDRADESLGAAEVFRLARRSGSLMAAMLQDWLAQRG